MGASTVTALAGIALAIVFFLLNRSAADDVARTFSGLYRLLLNKYYVDEIYDAAVVQPIRIVSEDGLWKGVDVGVIDGAVNGVGRHGRRARARCCGVCRPDRCARTRRRCWSAWSSILGYYLLAPEMHVSDSDLLVALPIVGALLLLFVRDDEQNETPVRADRADRVTARVRRDAAAVEPRSTPRRPTSSSSSATPGFRRSASATAVGVDGISLLLVVLTGIPDAARAARLVGVGAQAHEGVLHVHAAARERDDRRLRLARSVPVLRVLGRDADPDVLPDRHLGLRPPHLRRGEVHALHDGRQRADAAGDSRRSRICTARRPAHTASTC